MSTTTAPAQTHEGEELLQQITRHVFLVLLQISWPKMAYQIADAIVEVTGNDNKRKEIKNKFRSNPRWQLMPEEWKKKLGQLEGRARSLVAGASVQFAARGMAVLPVVRAAEIFSLLRICRAEMEQYSVEFTANYAKVLEDLRAEIGDELYASASKKLPDQNEIKEKFGIKWAIVPAGGSSLDRTKVAELRALLANELPALANNVGAQHLCGQLELAVSLVDELENNDVSQVTDQEADALVKEAKEQMSQFTKEMLEDMAREPRQILAAAADNLVEALSDRNRVIRTGTIEQVRRAFQMVEGFSFLAGPELLDRMARLRSRLDDATPQELNSNRAAGAALANALRGVRDVAANAQESAEAVRNFRGIRVRGRETANVE